MYRKQVVPRKFGLNDLVSCTKHLLLRKLYRQNTHVVALQGLAICSCLRFNTQRCKTSEYTD